MDAVTRTANALMNAVVNAGVVTHDNIDLAVQIMRRELKSLLAGEGAYVDAREAVLQGAIHEGWVFRLLVTECVAAIRSGA